MFISARKRIVLGVAALPLALGGITACDSSGESATENFKKDLSAVGLKVDGDVTIDREKKTLSMAPIGFVAKPKPKPKTDSDSDTNTDSKNDSGSNSGSDKSKKDNKKAATKAPSSSPSTKSTKAPKSEEILEALVKLKGSNDCRVELERPKKPGTDSTKVKDRDIEHYTIDEIDVNGKRADFEGAPGALTMQDIVSQIKNDAASNKLCFA